MLLSQLPDATPALVARVVSSSPEVDAVALRRLGELGFIPGEPVQVMRRGPGGREPLAVLIGETLFALRLIEAQCVEVTRDIPRDVGSAASSSTSKGASGSTSNPGSSATP